VIRIAHEAQDELVAAFRAAAVHGLNEGIDNHFSLAATSRGDLFFLNRYGPDWSEMEACDILTIDFDGNVIDGDGSYEVTAFMIHRGVHISRPSAQCVMHTHMPYATALSMTTGGLDTRASQNAMYFHGRIQRLSYAGHADGVEEGLRIGQAIDDHTTAVMLDGHGVIVIGADVADAWHKLYFLERACQMQVLAQSTGDELLRVSEHVAEATASQWEGEAARSSQRLFDAIHRRLALNSRAD
jgi:ribulose-5-phosphate 4-epimerase/fuculose-1-phosphate aldolase